MGRRTVLVGLLLAGCSGAGLTACGAAPPAATADCERATFDVAPTSVAPGGSVTLASDGVRHCQDGDRDEGQYSVVVEDAAGGRTTRALGVRADGSFEESLVLPEDLPPGPVIISVRSGHSEFCVPQDERSPGTPCLLHRVTVHQLGR